MVVEKFGWRHDVGREPVIFQEGGERALRLRPVDAVDSGRHS